VIRFSAFLVVVAVGLLVAGVVTSKLGLVYIAIGVSGVALLALGIGAAVSWRELAGKPKTAASEASAQEPASAGAGWPAAAQSGPSVAGYLPTEQPLTAQPSSPRPVTVQPAAVQFPAVQPVAARAAAARGSRIPQAGDVQRPPAAFTSHPEAPGVW
jgi:hypothetical protein